MKKVKFVTVSVRMTANNHAMLKAVADSKHQPLAEFLRDVADAYCMEQRQAARMVMERHHYTARHADDYEECE